MSRALQAVVVLCLLVLVAAGGVLVVRSTRQQPADTATPPPNEVVVLAPCGFNTPVTVVANLFRKAHREIKLEVVMDNANVLVNKVQAGKLTGDAFMSPGETEMKLLVDSGHIVPSTVTDWGSLDMVVIASLKAKGVRTISDLALPSVRYIALPDPRLTSVGYYGEKALRALGLYDRIKGKLVTPDGILKAVELVETGDADAGLAYLTCPLETNPEKASKSALRIVETIPRDKYPPVRLQAGMLKTARNKAAAQEFFDFLTTKEAQDALAANGVLTVEGRRSGGSAALESIR
jgi:molybdate transport system substrate-binding protein